VSKSADATAALTFEAIKLQRSPMKSLTLKIFAASSWFNLSTLNYQLYASNNFKTASKSFD
jgi:hypothetical protein